ncbi:MAG: sulfur carrier protein ThiS [Candidatus Omnitrophica bacterium]|nr:sulfur carrier protein ThiS [Candidatus Omnitrophota bacterium]
MLQFFELKKKSVVLELNQKVVNRESYSETQLGENDTVEIVYFVGGG